MNELTSDTLQTVLQAFAMALLHSLWIGGLIALGYRYLLRRWVQHLPNATYQFALLAQALIVLCTAAAFAFEYSAAAAVSILVDSDSSLIAQDASAQLASLVESNWSIPVVLAWCVGVGICGLRLYRAHVRLRGIVRQATAQVWLSAMGAELCARLIPQRAWQVPAQQTLARAARVGDAARVYAFAAFRSLGQRAANRA
jgi:beta-lactamase regulating signal transducer with metallopeptidase domain